MGRTFTPAAEELDLIRSKIKAAREDAETQRKIRERNLNAYFRLPLGNENPDRSTVIDTMVYNHISGLHPHLMRRYLQTDIKIGIRGPEEKIAKALKQKIRDDINSQGGYTLINDVLLDGEIAHNGTVKVWWSRVFGEPQDRETIVTREQLMQLVDDPRFVFGPDDVMALPAREAEVSDGIPTAESPTGTIFHVKGVPMYRVRCVQSDLEESGPIIAAMPPEEFIVERGKARINDRKGVGHVRKILAGELQRENDRRSLPDEPYYKNLKKAVEAGDSGAGLEMEKTEREAREDLVWSGAPPVVGAGLRKEVEVVEWCDWVEDGDKLVPAFLVFVGNELLRCEENEDGIIPYSTWSPVPSPHSIIGQSIAAQHVDAQNVRTVLTRALLDNVGFSIDRPRWVRNRGTDMLGLTKLAPGKLLYGNPEDVVPLEMGEISPHVLKVLEYLKAEGEERGPATRLNQGTDGGPGGNDTATGIKIVQRASFSKIDLIAMAFSELLLVDLYNKLIILYQRNLDLPVTVKVDGEEIALTKKSIQGKYAAYSDVGAIVDFDDRAFQQSNALLSMQVGLLNQGIYPFAPASIKESIKDVFVAGGRIDPAKYLEIVVPEPKQPPDGPGGAPGGPPGAPPPQGGPEAPAAPSAATPGDQTLEGGAADPGAGMGAGQ